MGRGLDQPGLNTSQLVNKWMALVHGLVVHCELRLAHRAWHRSWPGLRPTVDRVCGGRDEAVASAGPMLGAKAQQAEPLMDPRHVPLLAVRGRPRDLKTRRRTRQLEQGRRGRHHGFGYGNQRVNFLHFDLFLNIFLQITP